MWIASATPETLSTRWEERQVRVGYVGWVRATQYLSGAGEHAFTGVQTCTTGILNLLDLRASFPDD